MEDKIYLMTETGLQNLMTRKEDFKRNPDIFLKANEPLSYSFNGYQSLQEKKSDYFYLKIQSDGTAIANIFGSLDKNPDSFDERYNGVINLTKLLADVEKAKTDEKVKKMVFVYDSPGGTVSGTPELAKAIYDFGKPNYGYITGQCCSGALWLGVNHNNLYASSGLTNYIGSVGVVTMHIDQSKFYEEEIGYKVSLITNKKSPHKTDGNRFEPLSEQARTEIVKKADEIYEAFVETIKKNYPDTPEEFLDGRVFSATDAKNFGIIKNIVEQKKIFTMDLNEGSNPAAATASNLSPTAQNGGSAVSANADNAVLALLTEIKTSIGSLETKIEAKVDEKLSALEERFQAIETKIGLKTKSSKVIAMVEDEEGFKKADPPKKQEYRAVNTLPAIIDDRKNVLKHFKSVDEHDKFLAVAEKYLSREAFTPEFFSMAFDATRFNNEVGQFFEVVAYTYKENLLKYETLKYLKMFDGVVDKIYLASSYKKKFLSLHSEARRDVVVVETSPNSISVKILSGRTKQDMLTLQQTALSYIEKPKNTDPYNVMSYWQWQIIYQSVIDAIMDDMGEAVWIGQENTYAIVADEANPLNAFDGLLTIIRKNLALPTPDIGLHITGALTAVNTYEKLRDMLRAIPKDVMTEARKSGKGIIYMNQNTYNKFLDSVKDAFATNIYNTVFEHKAVYGYLYLPIVENDFLPNDAILIDPTNVLAYATHTGADQTNIKVEAHLFDIYLHGHLKLGAGIVNYYWNNPDDLKYRVHVNDVFVTNYTLRPQLP